MANLTLYCFAQSGNAYKVALMLELCGAVWRPRFVDFFNGETRTEAYRREVNPMGEVPVLVDGERKLTQSGAILDSLAQRYGVFGAGDADERYEILRWLLWDNHKLTSYTATLRSLRSIKKVGETPVVAFLSGRALAAYDVLERHLDEHDFLVGGRVTIADISACGYLFWPDEIGVDWQDYPAIAAWLDRIRGLPGWKHPYDLLPGHPLPENAARG